MILAIDPGMRKIGWALLEEDGRPLGQGILAMAGWEQALSAQAPLGQVEVVVLGDGTNRVNTEEALARLCPQARIRVVNESGSTVDAWRLKLSELAGRNALKRAWLWLDQLFNAANVDDYAARVLGQRYIGSRS